MVTRAARTRIGSSPPASVAEPVVYPAAALPHQAKENGARVIVINPNENPYKTITDVYLDEASGEEMPRVMEHVRSLVDK